MRNLCLPLGEGGSRVPRKRETDEGNLPLTMGKVPGRGGEGDFYPLSRLRRQLPQRGSQGGTDCHTSLRTGSQ